MSDTGSDLYFLKLGGSLITDKTRPHTARMEVITRLAQEIALARQVRPELHLILGHGSGSYGHVPARKYNTRQEVRTPEEWLGFLEVWREAAALNRLVVDALTQLGLPALAFSPLASVSARDGQVETWNLAPLQAALAAGLLPVIQGDVIFDRVRGGTILSTEDLFVYLAYALHPSRILLAGLEPGVWEDYPTCHHIVKEITPHNIAEYLPALGGSSAMDVTGGMVNKVLLSVQLVSDMPDLQVNIFSGEIPGLLEKALSGQLVGTLIQSLE